MSWQFGESSTRYRHSQFPRRYLPTSAAYSVGFEIAVSQKKEGCYLCSLYDWFGVWWLWPIIHWRLITLTVLAWPVCYRFIIRIELILRPIPRPDVAYWAPRINIALWILFPTSVTFKLTSRHKNHGNERRHNLRLHASLRSLFPSARSKAQTTTLQNTQILV